MNCVQMTLHSAATFNFISFAVFFSIHFILDIHERLSHFNHIKTYGFYAYLDPDWQLFYIQWLWFLFELIYFFICCHLRCWKPLQLPHSLRFLCYFLFFYKVFYFIRFEPIYCIWRATSTNRRFSVAYSRSKKDKKWSRPAGSRKSSQPEIKRDLRKWKWIVLAQQPQQRERESAIVTKLNVKVWLWIQVKVIKSKIFEKHIQCIAMSMIT